MGPAGAPTPGAIITILILCAAPDPGAAQRVPTPARSYGSFAAVRDSVEEILRTELGVWADSALWARDSIWFEYRRWDGDSLRLATLRMPALTMTLDDAAGKAPDVCALAEALAVRGWNMDNFYGADGPDGTRFAFTCREALCLFAGHWDGGDDSDSTYVSSPWHGARVTCVPAHAP